MANGQVNFGQNDVTVDGAFYATNFIPNTGCIDDNAVKALAGIAASKLQHQRQPVYQQEAATTVVTEKRAIAVVYGATGLLVAMKAYTCVAAVGAATVTIRLKRTRATVTTTVTSSDITINSGTAIYTLVNAAGFTATDLQIGDILEVDVTATVGGGTLPKGLGVQLIFKEDAQ